MLQHLNLRSTKSVLLMLRLGKQEPQSILEALEKG